MLWMLANEMKLNLVNIHYTWIVRVNKGEIDSIYCLLKWFESKMVSMIFHVHGKQI